MTQKIRTRILFACAGTIIASAAVPALAQVAPPPPEAPEKDEEYTPPEPQPQRGMTVRPNRQGTQSAAQNSQDAAPQNDRPKPRRQVSAPRIPFRTMVVRAEETGEIIRLTKPYALVALAHNPTIAENKRDVVMPVVNDRHARQEERILQNLDLYIGFEFGMHREMNMGDIQMLQTVTRQLKPLTEQGDIATDLEDAGVFSPSQRAMNNVIVQDYQRQVSEEIKGVSGREIGPMFLQIIEDALVEPRFAYGLLIIEMIKNGPEVVAKAGLEGADGIDELAALLQQGWPEDNDSRAQMVADAKSALSNLQIDQHEQLLRASRQMREDVGVPPLPEIPLTVGEQVGMNEMNMGLTIKHHDEHGNVIREHKVGGAANKDDAQGEGDSEDSDG